jgi:hypothetical protein
MQHYTIFFITIDALHVSGGFSAHHQELKTVHTASGIPYFPACKMHQPIRRTMIFSLEILEKK